VTHGSTPDPLGTLLKRFRKRHHFTQQQLAGALGVHRMTIGRWEEGSFLPESKALVLELARVLSLDDQETRQLLEASLTALTPHWSVPLPRNPFFTGREEVLEALHAQLGVEQTVALTQSSVLHGLGGVGKTQIALEYAYRHSLEYSATFWIGAETDEQTIASLVRIAEVLQVPGRDDKDPQRVVGAIHQWLNSHSGWLLIWDNVEDLDVFQRFLPPTRQGAVLITTRCQALGTLAQGLDLLPMQQQEGILFLLRRAKVLHADLSVEQVCQFAACHPAQYQAAAEFVEVLGGLPLALDQAGAYLEETRCGLPAYLERFRTRRAALLRQRGEQARDHPASVSTTFRLSITATAERHPAVRDLLQVCALLQPDAIPEELFRKAGTHLGLTLEAVCGDPLEWDRVVGIACSYSLLSRQPEAQTLSVHRLVQAVLLDGMVESEHEQWNVRLIQMLDAVFPEVGPLTAAAARQQGRGLLPHVLPFLQRSTQAPISASLASLAYKTAQYLREGGQYTDAQPLFVRALSLYEHLLGYDSREVAMVCNYLGVLYGQQGQYAQAKPFFVRALRIYEQQDPEHPDITSPLENLANVLKSEARYTEALPLLHRVLRIREQALGPRHQKLAQTFHNLGDLYASQEQYAEAKPYLERALQLLEQSPDQPPTALTLASLGDVCCKLGQYAEAQRFLLRAWQLWRKQLGPDHPIRTHALAALGRLAFVQGHAARAGRLYQRALRIWELHPHYDPPELAILLTNLAELRQQQGEDAEAAALYQRALGMLEEHLSPKHPRTVRAQQALELLRERQRRREEAHLEAVAGQEQAGGAKPPLEDLRTLLKARG
jgi:tetratricopeptide (TPR) repeat protein/transcriptional regulator with XRE-family HTH domain